MPSKNVITILKTNAMNFLCHFLSTFLSPQAILRDPTTITNSVLFCFFSSYILFQTCSSSEKVVAPSASSMRAYFPLTRDMPALTAPPLPLFLGYQMTTRLRPSFEAYWSATSVVLSLLPSLATMIQCWIFRGLKYFWTSVSMRGILSYSLQAGTTSEISGSGALAWFQRYSGRWNFWCCWLVMVMGSYWRLSKFFFQFLQGWRSHRKTTTMMIRRTTAIISIIGNYYNLMMWRIIYQGDTIIV